MSKSVVVFYSWAGHTKRMTEYICKQTGADMVEIIPQKPYSQNYEDVLTQAKQEIREGCLPPITNKELAAWIKNNHSKKENFKMKKILSLMCVFSMLLTMAACSGQSNRLSASSAPQSSKTMEPEQTNKPQQIPEEKASAMVEHSEEVESTGTEEEGSGILVVYFSVTGTTKTLAGYVAEVTKGDLFEIVPEEPYTADDLNYSDYNSRSSLEQNDESARPAISGSLENMDQYDTVFLGYPIWWGEAPRIIYTFMESYDFSGKTIVPFCTSGGSGVGASARNLHELAASNVTWLDGIRLESGISHNEMVSWMNGLGLDVTAQ